MMTDTAVATDGMFSINAAGSTHPINGLVDGATTMTTAHQFSEPTVTDGIVGKVLAAGIAAKGAEIATTAGDKTEGLVATSDAAVHHVTTTAPKGMQVHVAATPEKFSFIAFKAKLSETAKAVGREEPTVIEVLRALLAEKDVAYQLSTHGIKVDKLAEFLKKEAAEKPAAPLPQALKDTFFELEAMEAVRENPYCAKETFRKTLHALETDKAVPMTFSAVHIKTNNLTLFPDTHAAHHDHTKTHGHHTEKLAKEPTINHHGAAMHA